MSIVDIIALIVCGGVATDLFKRWTDHRQKMKKLQIAEMEEKRKFLEEERKMLAQPFPEDHK